jgi:hypothetical protein
MTVHKINMVSQIRAYMMFMEGETFFMRSLWPFNISMCSNEYIKAIVHIATVKFYVQRMS